MNGIDLVNERKKATFNTRLLTYLLDDGKDRTERRHYLQNIIESDAVFDNSQNAYMHRRERHVRSLAKHVRMIELCRENNIECKDTGEVVTHEDFYLILRCISDDLPTALHWIMFVPNIISLMDKDQRSYWLGLCRDWKVIGCYAQTELGHGSNIRALETTATFIPEDKCGLKGGAFDINSPTITSTKFWPGTLGRTANHAMVIARLIDGKGTDHGIHNFIVPLRCMDTHKLLKGVRTGDIGPKIGYNNMDNGFASFNHVLIPRRNMAMGFASVDEHGRYSKKKVSEATSKISYLTMMHVRVLIISDSGTNLAKACTIAIRYSAQRRQGYSSNGEKELQIIDYTQQQYRLFSLLACAYTFHITGKAVQHYLNSIHTRLVSSGNSQVTKTQMQDFHASSSALKSFCSTITANGIEDARKSCGGHGFLQASGIPELSLTYLQNPTVEGDNYMLPQHVVKVLLKLPQQLLSTKDIETIRIQYKTCDSYYLIDPLISIIKKRQLKCHASSVEDFFHIPTLLEAYAQRSAQSLLEVYNSIKEYVLKGSSQEEAWNQSLILMYNASKAHSLYLLIRNFYLFLQQQQDFPVLQDLCILFALFFIEKDYGDFLLHQYFTSDQILLVRKALLLMFKKLRPNVVALVDAWDFSDFQLKSALGNYSGNVYPKIMESAFKEPLNEKDVGPGYEHLLKLYKGNVGVWKNKQTSKL